MGKAVGLGLATGNHVVDLVCNALHVKPVTVLHTPFCTLVS